MVKILDQTEDSVTYLWYCPECLSANIHVAFDDRHIVCCQVCSLQLINVAGNWERGPVAPRPLSLPDLKS